MSQYLLQARSESTVSRYFSYFRKWEDFIVREHACALPAQPIHVTLYVSYLLDKGSSYNVVNAAVYAIKWAHSISSLPDPTENGVKNMVEAAKRQERTPRVKKDCVSSELLIQLCKKYKDSNDALIVRDLAMIVVSFAGFLRFDELSRLRMRDVAFRDTYVSLNIEKSKTDQYRFGSEVVISKGETVACPYRMLERYIKLSNILEPNDFLFKPFVRSGGVCKPILKCKALSYTRARECVVQRLKEIDGGLNLGLHS
ncbi:uncharacterized protein LOC132556976 [Ylistrum balloti]|uniref:uncharacterized protein LOC132556976 n=1 Tax=Ylistrum balloti TaxID=509963 RepID=UPI002905DF6C|nr:uncharacterized protein LOC132556976 [Ylistrum balloti]